MRRQDVSLLRALYFDAGILEVVEPRGMRGEQVVVVEAVFDQQLPVGADVVFLRALDHLHATRGGLVEHEVDVLGGAAEILLQRRGVDVEVEEDEAAVVLDARRRHEAELRAVEVRRIGALAGYGIEAAIAVIGPAVIEAGVALRVAARLAAHDRATMAAGVQEHAQRVLAVAAEDQRPAAHAARTEVAGRAHFGLVADVHPAALEDALFLGSENPRVDERCSIDFETLGPRIVQHQPGCAHASIIGEWNAPNETHGHPYPVPGGARGRGAGPLAQPARAHHRSLCGRRRRGYPRARARPQARRALAGRGGHGQQGRRPREYRRRRGGKIVAGWL